MHTTLKLILGLGNPGTEFENTYHNVGALALEAIAQSLDVNREDWTTHKKIFSYAKTKEVILVQALTFMNESGIAAKEALKKFNVVPRDMIVVHDDSDLTIGTFKISEGKSSAGHRGVQSIIDHVSTNEFSRIRIGIRAKNELKRKKALDFVLAKITPTDQKELEKIFEEIIEIERIQ